jgi:plasmid stabilization system protein ParE
MPQFAVEFHPLAADEAQAAERWYRERNEIASGRFQRELDRAIERIFERPEAGSPYLVNTRRILLRRFPLFVVYRVHQATPKASQRTRDQRLNPSKRSLRASVNPYVLRGFELTYHSPIRILVAT